MAVINFKEKLIQVKIVYYGPGRSGKTTNLIYIYDKLQQKLSGRPASRLITIDTRGDRTLFFDFFPVDLGKIYGMDLKIQLYTTPGQVVYNTTRKLVLKGVDGVVFVADSLPARRQANIESLQNLKENLAHYNLKIEDIPLVFQWNKRDLEDEGLVLLDIETLEDDLNKELKAPSFPASAIRGYNVFQTLKQIAKLTISSVIRKFMLSEQIVKVAGG
ncbi:MAG: GTPase domain-containing protein [Candidatus Desulfofervidus auxilii]|nr:GTPase domain-containing protein [Candidatus Desulfofervidus auxilii]